MQLSPPGLDEATFRRAATLALQHPNAEVQAVVADELERIAPLLRFGPRWLRGTAPSSWRWEWEYQRRIYAALHRVTTGECRRMMLFVPPRHTKTETVTVRYASWRIERDPGQRVIVGTYSQDQANLYARKIRRIVAPRVPLSKDSKRVDDWETVQGGGLRSVGVGGGVTGRGANLIIIDDPVKSREEADSEAYRERCWEWYTEDLWTRQEPGAAILLIMTRWHEDDLAGRLIQAAREGGEQWEVINFPALAEPGDPLGREVGEALCPERFDVDALKAAQGVLGRNYYALYQGRPQAAEGSIFKAEWFQTYREEGPFVVLPSGERIRKEDIWSFLTVDPAATEKTSGDWTVISTWGVTPRRQQLLLDVRRFRCEGPEVKRAIREALRGPWRPQKAVIGKAGLGLPIVQDLVSEGLPVQGVIEHGDKVARALGAAARYESAQVFHPAAAPWLDEWERELLSFPNAAHDDQVDTASTAAAMLGQVPVVFSEFNPSTHCHSSLAYSPGRPLVCGWSFLGGWPAWVVAQLDGSGQLLVVGALKGARDEGVWEFGAKVLRFLGNDSSNLDLRHFAHPAHCGITGVTRPYADAWLTLAAGVSSVKGYTPGGRVIPNGKPSLTIRLAPVGEPRRERLEEGLRHRLNSLVHGLPGFQADPETAGPVVEALSGGYRYKQNAAGQPGEGVDLSTADAAVAEALCCAIWGLQGAAPRSEEDWGPELAGTASGAGRKKTG